MHLVRYSQAIKYAVQGLEAMIYRRSKIVGDQNYSVSKSKSYRHCKDLPRNPPKIETN